MRLQVPSAVELWIDGRSVAAARSPQDAVSGRGVPAGPSDPGAPPASREALDAPPEPGAVDRRRARSGRGTRRRCSCRSTRRRRPASRATCARRSRSRAATCSRRARASARSRAIGRRRRSCSCSVRTCCCRTRSCRPTSARTARARCTARRSSATRGAWNAALQLAGMMAGNGRPIEAIAALREAATRFPEVPAILVSLADLLRKQGWDAEADSVDREAARARAGCVHAALARARRAARAQARDGGRADGRRS